MARRSSSGSGDSCLGCLGIFLILGLISIVIKILPYLLVIVLCGLGIWGLIALLVRINEKTNGSSTRIKNTSSSIAAANFPHDEYVCSETDRQIKSMLVRRSRLKWMIVKLSLISALLWLPAIINKQSIGLKREQLEQEKAFAKSQYAAAVYSFRDSIPHQYSIVKNLIETLKTASAKVYDSSPAISSVIVPYQPKGDMKYIHFSEEPVCMHLGNSIFCITPYYVVRFKNSGAYMTTYYSDVLYADMGDGAYNERIKHVTWTHTRMDGGPDRRYKYNPQRVYYTTLTHSVRNMLQLDVAEFRLKYAIDNSLRDRILSAIRTYSAMRPDKVFDGTYHLMRLLSECDKDSVSAKRLLRVVDGGIYTNDASDYGIEGAIFKSGNNAWNVRTGINIKPAVRTFLIVFSIALLTILLISSVFALRMRSDINRLDEQEIASITDKWVTDGVVDYPDVTEFEKAINNGERPIGKTLTFKVLEIHPDSGLGFDLWAGEHLNFVSKEDPGVKEGDELTVIVTGVKRVISDSFKITYIILEK